MTTTAGAAQRLRLYDLDRSGNCYKIRLMLSLLGLEYEKVAVDANAGENRRPEFLRLNPRGQLPVLEAGEDIVWDSTAILVYLARQYGGERWLPADARGMAAVMQWLALEQNENRYGLARARAASLRNPTAFATRANPEECRELGETALGVLETRLDDHDWLVGDRMTIADIACYPYVAMAPEGGFDLESYPGIRAWIGRIKSLPGYVALPQAQGGRA